jgi:hypothetical protein
MKYPGLVTSYACTPVQRAKPSGSVVPVRWPNTACPEKQDTGGVPQPCSVKVRNTALKKSAGTAGAAGTPCARAATGADAKRTAARAAGRRRIGAFEVGRAREQARGAAGGPAGSHDARREAARARV